MGKTSGFQPWNMIENWGFAPIGILELWNTGMMGFLITISDAPCFQ
jgi:hypothetical protein